MSGLADVLRNAENQGREALATTLERLGVLEWDPLSQSYTVRAERGARISGDVLRRETDKTLGRSV